RTRSPRASSRSSSSSPRATRTGRSPRCSRSARRRSRRTGRTSSRSSACATGSSSRATRSGAASSSPERARRASKPAAFAGSGSPFVSLLTAIAPRSRVSTLCARKTVVFTLSAMTAAAIRVLVVDDHPAVRQGIEAMLGHEDGIVCIGTAASAGEAHELWPAAERLPADVVVVDRHLPDEDGLSLCLWLRTRTPAPAVVIYSAFADEALVLPAVVAGACALIGKVS